MKDINTRNHDFKAIFLILYSVVSLIFFEYQKKHYNGMIKMQELIIQKHYYVSNKQKTISL
ncbi:MAG: hypothetical protein A2X59_11800 [Nitrospirae bacterium GWC2_42_7]|nr:MAG: hypothetical protein A2X59_11800 [Nitrospirae bacterium GWC2_42_7]